MLLSLVSAWIQVSTGREERMLWWVSLPTVGAHPFWSPVTPGKYTKEGTGDTDGLGLSLPALLWVLPGPK